MNLIFAMNKTQNIVKIYHFSDILCVWAYIAQIRIDELKRKFGRNLEIKYYYLPVFGDVETFLKKNWGDKGGVEAYNKHVLSIANEYSHVKVNKDIWLLNQPTTSINCHLMLKAIQLVEIEGDLNILEDGTTALEAFAWELRLAFFRDADDISNYNLQLAIAEKLKFPIDKIEEKIRNGEAYVALYRDYQLKSEYQVKGSPTLMFNEGRQLLYGNVGFNLIESNIRELLRQPENQASWC